jgi:hypothetical protein
MGEVVPRCGAGSLIKIIVRESMCKGVMGVQVGTLSRRCFQVLVSVRIRCS